MLSFGHFEVTKRCKRGPSDMWWSDMWFQFCNHTQRIKSGISHQAEFSLQPVSQYCRALAIKLQEPFF